MSVSDFTDKIILITGGSSGIGAGAAEHLAKLGAKVAIVGLNERKLDAVIERIKSTGASTPLKIIADVTIDAERIISETVNHFGKLEVLINCAGVQSHNTVENIELAEYDRIMNVNVRSIVQLSKLAVPHLEKSKSSSIVNVSSACGLRVKPNLFAYCISKSAVNQLTKSAALDLAPKQIRVNAINPVVVKTSIFETGFGMSPQQVEEFYAKHSALYPVGRVGEVSDTSVAIEFLISDKASFITGLLLPVDGGALTAGQ